MCTVSIIGIREYEPGAAGYRLVCNRDESRKRAPAAAPRWRSAGETGVRGLWPMDLDAGGTWLGVSEHGMALAVLNLNDGPAEPKPADGVSRGLLIPELIGEAGAADVFAKASGMDLRPFSPFRIIAIEPGEGARIGEARWTRREFGVIWHREGPACFTSSGLGDALVRPRLGLFDEMVLRHGPSPERQDEFHRHTWPDRPHLSVLMGRSDARTVSITTLEVRPGEVPHMVYEPLGAGAAEAVPGRWR
jgi:hypothetical protein